METSISPIDATRWRRSRGLAGSTVSQVSLLDITSIPNLSLLGIAQSADGVLSGARPEAARLLLSFAFTSLRRSERRSATFATDSFEAGLSYRAARWNAWKTERRLSVVTRIVPGVYRQRRA